MLYAKVVFGLPVEGPFDYSAENLDDIIIRVGCRVYVSFGNQKKIGYVVKLTTKSDVKKIKTIYQILDQNPLLNKELLLLTKKISEYYCCSWGQAIETALPESIRRGKRVYLNDKSRRMEPVTGQSQPNIILAHSQEIKKRWDNIYLDKIKDALNHNKTVIVLLPDITSLSGAEKIIRDNFNCSLSVLYRKRFDELKEWTLIKEGKVDIVIGTRSGVFAPLDNLGLIIIDEEQARGYKQDQTPHYHARSVALMRTAINQATLIIGSSTPSLESMYLAKKKKIEYLFFPGAKNSPEIKIIDMKDLPLISPRKKIILSKYFEDSIIKTLNSKGKVLLFLNRLGFATFSSCVNCGAILKCQRCNTVLVFHYKENILNCHYCNFKMEPPKICPYCNSGYIRYLGAGIEKLESEFSRIFPQARVKQLEGRHSIDISSAEIFLSTQTILKETGLNFELIGVVSIDAALNLIDFRAQEKVFNILTGLSALTDKQLIIQTSLPDHHVFKALVRKNSDLFFNEELKQRKELKFPPYCHLALIKLRGKKEERVEAASKIFFEKLKKQALKSIEIISVGPGYPSKLRGNFYWQIALKSKSPIKISKFIKIHLNSFRHSGIIVTGDVDPI